MNKDTADSPLVDYDEVDLYLNIYHFDGETHANAYPDEAFAVAMAESDDYILVAHKVTIWVPR